MACGSCSTGSCGTLTGTEDQALAEKSGGCGSEGCHGCTKLNTFDWLAGMETVQAAPFPIVEVKFKGGRKNFYRNDKNLPLITGDPVVVDVKGGHHIGYISLQGELVRLQLKKHNKGENDPNIRGIYRKATEKDLNRFYEARNREISTLYRTRQLIKAHNLPMKLSDVEYQADNNKATFYYSATERVDFRNLIKDLASEFKIRVEMRQISLRQEAGRLGGIGSCGRELCCSTWLTDFKSVSTSAARYQSLSLNPTKLAGQCGRLKCCLNYELDTYMEALKQIPDVQGPLKTEKGEAFLQKTDIFRKLMWFGYKGESTWHPLDTERVRYILQQNQNGQTVAALTEEEEENAMAEVEGILNQDLAQWDKELEKKERKSKKQGRGRPGGRGRGPGKPPQQKGGHGATGTEQNQEKGPFEGGPAKDHPQQKPQGEGSKPGNKRRRKPGNKRRGGGGGKGNQGGSQGD